MTLALAYFRPLSLEDPRDTSQPLTPPLGVCQRQPTRPHLTLPASEDFLRLSPSTNTSSLTITTHLANQPRFASSPTPLPPLVYQPCYFWHRHLSHNKHADRLSGAPRAYPRTLPLPLYLAHLASFKPLLIQSTRSGPPHVVRKLKILDI